MRGLLASSAALAVLLALFCHATAEFPEILPGDSEHTIGVKKALQKMDLKKLAEKMQKSDEAAAKTKLEPPNHGLVSNAASGFGSPFCEPGFTGGNCEYPICDTTNRHDHNPSAEPDKITVDFYYATNSTQFFYVYFDLTMHGQEFQLQSDLNRVINPMMHLVDQNGNIITPAEQENGPSKSTYTFYYTLPGVYKVQLLSDNPDAPMLATFNAWTYLTTELGGITYTSLEDAKKSDFPDESTTFFTNTQTLFVTSPVGLDFPGSLSTISFFTESDTTPHSTVLLLRYGCHYMYYTAEFSCTREGYYFARIRGYDFEGHSFVRTHSYVCELGLPSTTAAPTTSLSTTPSGPINCQNGGAPITRSDGTQVCYCNGLWTGTYCSTPLCMNGGTPRSSLCVCPDGFSGSHCQRVQCVDDAGSGFLIGTPILTFVIRVRTSMSAVISQVQNAIQRLVDDIAYDPPYISKFGLVLFNNNGSTATQYHNPQDLLSALTTAAQTPDTSGNCSDIMYGPILEALTRFLISNKSPIYVITDGIPADNHLAEDVNVLNSYYQAPINFIYIEPSASSQCPLFDTQSPGFRPIIETSFRFSGIASFVSAANRGSTGELIYQHMTNTYHKAHLMFSDDQRDCANLPRYIPLSIDAKFHRLAVIAEGVNATLQLNQPDGTVSNFSDSFTLGYVNMLGKNGLQIGTWTLSVINQSVRTGCSVRVYAVEDPTPGTNGQDYHMVFGITPTLTQDAPEVQPIIGFKQSIVAHIENYPYKDPWSVNAEIIVFTDGSVTGNGRQLVMASNGIWRDRCSYEIYFPPFYCVREGINIYFTVFVKDDRGNQIQRAGVFYCAAFSVQPQPSPGTCANGGVPTGNGTCFCQPGWTGQYCTTRQCYNNGTLDPAGFCQCPPGTGGESCEYLRCITQNDRERFNNHNRHLLWILDVSNNNIVPLNDMARYITELVRDIASQHKDWISIHNVIGVDSQQIYNLGMADGGDVGTMQAIFNNASTIATSSQDRSGRIMLYEAILGSRHFINRNSFIAVFATGAPDESNSTNVLDGYDSVLTGNHLLNVFAATDASGNYRFGNESDWSIVRDLADITTGRFTKLQPTNFYLGMKLIPTWYSSSLVYYKSFDNCATNGSIFVPVDSFAQAVQIFLNGQGANIATNLYVQQPDGSTSTLVSSIVSDAANNFAAYDIRKPCDDGWESGGPNVPYCFYAFRLNATWNAAQQVCLDAGGFLVDDMTQSKDDFLGQFTDNRRTWIGLNSKTGIWNWDRGSAPASPLGTETFQPWSNGDGSVDANNPCVYRGTDGKWYKTGCDIVSGFYVCQKYQYTDEYTPNDINDDDLPAGRWTVSFTSPGACSIVVRVQSSIQVYSGFVTHLLDDFPLADGVSNSTDNRLITHLVGVGTVNNIPFLDRALVLDAKNATVYRAATYQYRIRCSYEYLSQNFTCPNSGNVNNRFDVLHIGEDQYGLPFQRVTSGVCAAPRTTCRNGGLFYNGQCYCNEYWEGIYCEVPICVNGGFVNTADNTCQCPTGFAGHHCQYDVCYHNITTTFSNDGKAFIVVLEATTQNQNAVRNFGANLASTLNTILSNTSTNWFNQYILLTFDANQILSTDSTPDVNNFVGIYNQRTATLSTANSCDLPIFKAISAAVTDSLPSQSIMYLITTGGSSSADSMNSGWNAFNSVATTDVMINYVLINSAACNTTNEINTNGSINVAEAAISTDGNIFFISDNQVTNFALVHLPTLYGGSVLNTPSIGLNGQQTCAELTYYFTLGQNVNMVYLYVYAQDAAPSITNPDGSATDPGPIYKDNYLYLYSFKSKGQGMYTLSINDVSACMVQVRITGGVQIFPGYISVPSSAPQVGSHLDNTTAIPTAGTNVLALHVNSDVVGVQYARLWPTYSAMGEIQYVQLYPRYGCSYEWYSDPFVCDEAGYFITVFGLGSRGAPFARHFYTRCNGYNGTTVAPPTGPTTPIPTGPPVTTVPGQTTTPSKYYPVTADVVFLIDNSESFTQAQFTDTANFILNALQPFNVGGTNNLHVALLSILGDYDQFAYTVANLNGIYDYNGLRNALNNAFQPDGPTSGTGNSALEQALRLVMSPDFKNAGYRPAINNHLIVYITAITSPNPPSIARAQTILNSGDYKIVAISYQGNGGNMAALTSLTGNAGCVLQSSTQADFTGAFAQSFTDKIFNAYQNGGNYC